MRGRLAATLAEAVERYMERCDRRDGCLLGPCQRYGMVRSLESGPVLAHRASYTVHNGPIPAGLVVRHTCDNPRCVEPTHLLVGTYKDNERDKIERNRSAVGLKNSMAAVPPEVIREAVAEYLGGGISQRLMAERLGVCQSTFGRWVMGRLRSDSGAAGVSVGSNSRIARPPLQPCGTMAGASRHRKAGEARCDPCVIAERAYFAAHRAKKAGVS